MNQTDPITQEQRLIARIVDGEANDADWSAFRALAEPEPGLWRRLAEAQRDQDLLCTAIEDRLDVAEDVEIPVRMADAAGAFSFRLRAWSGWAAAAVVALAWIGVSGAAPRLFDSGSGQSAGMGATLSTRQALEQYLDVAGREGRIVRELPQIMVETRAVGDGGGVEVLYVRQFLERAVVDQMYEVSFDELGNPQPIPVNAIQSLPQESL